LGLCREKISKVVFSRDVKNMNILQDLVKSEYDFTEIRKRLLNNSDERVELIKSGLHDPSQRGTCLRLLKFLNPQERESLFNDLLELASLAHADIELCHEIILTFPVNWLLENIEKSAEPILNNATYEEYRCLLQLYFRIDHDLVQRLIDRALQQDDLDIIEAGGDFHEAVNLAANKVKERDSNIYTETGKVSKERKFNKNRVKGIENYKDILLEYLEQVAKEEQYPEKLISKIPFSKNDKTKNSLYKSYVPEDVLPNIKSKSKPTKSIVFSSFEGK